MVTIESYPPGHLCWVDLTAADLEFSRIFYAELFGWAAVDRDAPDGPPYVQFELGGRAVAGMGRMTAERLAAGGRPHWNVYVAVEDAGLVEQKVVAAGGAVLAPTRPVVDAGWMNVLRDPEGATFMTWQANQHRGAALVDEPGTWGWSELAVRDPERAQAFYGGLFGWAFEADARGSALVRVSAADGHPRAHFVRISEAQPDRPSAWTPYFVVEDCEQIASRSESMGGRIDVSPTDGPVGRFARLEDPQGGCFYVLERSRGAG